MTILMDNTKENETMGNIYHMVNAASARVYQLRRGHLPKVKPEHNHMITALKEVQERKLGLGILLVEVPKKETNAQRKYRET